MSDNAARIDATFAALSTDLELKDLRTKRDDALVKRAYMRQLERRGCYGGPEYQREINILNKRIADLSEKIDALVVIRSMRGWA
jgi:hypothetical protein